jgi:hypothetical protein
MKSEREMTTSRALDRNLVLRLAETAGPDELQELVQHLRAAGASLRKRPIDEILALLGEVAEAWLAPDSSWRRAAEEALPQVTGFSPEMIRYGLPLMFEPLRAPAVRDLLDRELGDRQVLDHVVNGRSAAGPGLGLHVLSGNIAGTGVIPIALSLAIKAPTLVKAAAGDRLTAAMFARSIEAVDSGLGSCVAVRYWSGGDRRCEEQGFDLADLVVISGSDASIEDARARCRSRFIGHGRKVSFAVVAREVLANETAISAAAEALAMDVSLWDQRGCLSPQICFVEGDFESACRFGETVGCALDRLAERLPPGEVSPDEAAAVRRFRDDAEWSHIGGSPTLLCASQGSIAWTVVVEPAAEFRPTPLYRSLRVLPLNSAEGLPRILAPAARFVECTGVAASATRRAAIAAILTRAGVHRVCALGHMQKPSLSWLQGGRPRIADWVTWRGVEE